MPNIVHDNPTYIPLKCPILISRHLSALGTNLCTYLSICDSVLIVVVFHQKQNSLKCEYSIVLSNVKPVIQLTFGALSQDWKELCKGEDAEISACAVCSLGFD